MNGLTPEQHSTLLRPLNGTRIAKRSQGGKQLSYLESWEIRAHLIRIFGFCNFDAEMEEYRHVTDRPYDSKPDNNGEVKQMVEVIYSARMRLTVRDEHGFKMCVYSEAAVGSASGPLNMLGDHHDNALKTAASDALKRCAINLGTQFGLSLYDDGRTADVVKRTLVGPEKEEENVEIRTADGTIINTTEQAAAVAAALGAEVQSTEDMKEEANA
jgi:recombination DNA repair RAD52 pathway protein